MVESNFSGSDRMIDLIKDNYRLIQVLSRFGIPLGFGDLSVEEICRQNNVDVNTFLRIVNYLNSNTNEDIEIDDISLPSLIEFLRKSHIYFLDYCLPAIRRKLLDGISLKESDVSFLIIKLFDEYVAEITAHMEEEERSLFPYVSSLTKGMPISSLKIATYSEHHENVGDKLKELKNIILKYCPPQSGVNLLNAALFDIYRCEEELAGHCKVEDNILVPSIRKLENSRRKNQ